MGKLVLQLAAVGVAGVVVWKLASIFFLPLFFVALKIALLAGIVLLAIWWINKNSKKKDSPQDDAPTQS